jgi:hypothetical protein
MTKLSIMSLYRKEYTKQILSILWEDKLTKIVLMLLHKKKITIQMFYSGILIPILDWMVIMECMILFLWQVLQIYLSFSIKYAKAILENCNITLFHPISHRHDISACTTSSNQHRLYVNGKYGKKGLYIFSRFR